MQAETAVSGGLSLSKKPPQSKPPELRRPRTARLNDDSSFLGTCALKMTLLMTDGVTFTQEIEPLSVMQFSVGKVPRDFSDSLRPPFPAVCLVEDINRQAPRVPSVPTNPTPKGGIGHGG